MRESTASSAPLERYLVEALLGSGGGGKVYRAHDTRLRRVVALKLVEAQEGDARGAVAAALREARAAAAIQHPSVAAIFDVGPTATGAFIVMEHVAGVSLRQIVGDASVEVATRIRWLTEIAGALAAAHAIGVLHRDIKPENVIVCADGRAKVLDFGIARLPRSAKPGATTDDDLKTLSGGGDLVGTPAYMAPEQIRDEALDGRVDQFAWGVLAYELLSGARPFDRPGGALSALMATLVDPPPPFAAEAGVPAEVGAAVLRALAKAPASRFPSMVELGAALAPFADPAGTPPSSGAALRARATLPSSPASRERPVQRPSPAPPAPEHLPPTRSPEPASPVEAIAPRPTSPAPVGVTMRSSSGLRDPDFSAPVDLEAHLALLPPEALGKGMFFSDLLALAATVRGRTVFDLCLLAGVPNRRYVPFRGYPMSDGLRLQLTVAKHLYPGLPIGEGLRRIGWRAFDALLGSHVGKAIFAVLDLDVESLVLHGPKAYQVTQNFGDLTVQKVDAETFLLHARGMPTFLETLHVGVLEGVLRHCGRKGRIRIATSGLDEATFELTLAPTEPRA
jgi:serine/threonine-protein kinase